MDEHLRLTVTFGKSPAVPNTVVLRSVTPPRRRTLLTHWTEARGNEAVRVHGTASVDFPWVGESLDAREYDNFVGTHVLLFDSDPRLLRLAEPGTRVPCWNAGMVLGHSLGSASVCLGQRGRCRDATFWNTSFTRVHVRNALAVDGHRLDENWRDQGIRRGWAELAASSPSWDLHWTERS